MNCKICDKELTDTLEKITQICEQCQELFTEVEINKIIDNIED